MPFFRNTNHTPIRERKSDRWTNSRTLPEKEAKRKGLNQLGGSQRSKDRQKWERELKLWVEQNLPPYCEMCGTGLNLSKAHSKKRNDIKTKEDYFEIAILCTTPVSWINPHGERETIMGCHGKAERMSREDMRQAIVNLISKRGEDICQEKIIYK